MKISRPLAALALLPLLPLAVACGGGDKPAADPSTSTATPTAESAAPTASAQTPAPAK
jgi:hypothetical protein